MHAWLAWLIALASTLLCLFFWFRDVRRIMRDRMSTVESAAGQLTTCMEKAKEARNNPETEDILARSEKIYLQAVEIYDRTLKKPWIYLPALLMGFEMIPQKR